ncbi:protein PHOTOPERIOD-INDEPENDENT EARLY FLOWERING 1-like [Zingiber officinale]|uniref:protein PHOTOPERIOD-INDEPENDENT EARLY FLOWERING 1-like n=1 Tax=Zingiber officinale TaxID=94328 RepID=UPI001C4CA8FC|nr:protein PHOTOPERIOD-INDEPENDENT EARLY FLOWERING 1-like [Zingiber officinale]XP_042422181.1 protein PHOTOPERIOD-INDEPENDENT EARLY FLOWERING 1-like [Zingiber officinale]
MASKGPRSKLDYETRARLQKALDEPREPPPPKIQWDHVLEEMFWLSKDASVHFLVPLDIEFNNKNTLRQITVFLTFCE